MGAVILSFVERLSFWRLKNTTTISLLPRNVSIVESCPFFGGSFIGGSTVFFITCIIAEYYTPRYVRKNAIHSDVPIMLILHGPVMVLVTHVTSSTYVQPVYVIDGQE